MYISYIVIKRHTNANILGPIRILVQMTILLNCWWLCISRVRVHLQLLLIIIQFALNIDLVVWKNFKSLALMAFMWNYSDFTNLASIYIRYEVGTKTERQGVLYHPIGRCCFWHDSVLSGVWHRLFLLTGILINVGLQTELNNSQSAASFN